MRLVQDGHMTERIEVEVCVIGAGPVGATLAAALATAGVRVAVVDAQALPPMELPEFDGRAYAIALTSKNLLEAAGLWCALPAVEDGVDVLVFRRWRPGEDLQPGIFVFGENGGVAVGKLQPFQRVREGQNSLC